MLSEVFQSCATFIFPFHISKATQKRRHEKILNDELNIHITYIFHMIFCRVATYYIFILTMYRCIFIYWEWLINICFASILIGFTTFDWNKKHCTKLTLLLCVLDYPLESFSECRFLLGTKEALCCIFHGLMEKQTIFHNFSSHWMFVLAVKHFIFIKKINIGFTKG